MNHRALNLQRFDTDITEDVNIKVIIEYVLCQLLAIGLENTDKPRHCSTHSSRFSLVTDAIK